MSNKYTNEVLAKNGGLDSARAMKTMQQVMTKHDLKQAVVYQFILSGSQSKAVYQATIKALMRHIRTKCRAEYIGGYEVGEEKGGLHTHCYVIIETAKHFPDDLLDVKEGEFLARLAKRKEISIRIEPPKNRMHGGAMFARMNTPEKLADCIKWASYGMKARSKDGVPGRETYFGSEFASNIAKRETQRQVHRDALTKSTKKEQAEPAVQQATSANDINDNGEEMTNNQLTPSAFKFLGAHYETCVDQGLNLTEIQTYLGKVGIHKSLLAIKHDLSNVFEFHRYAETHPALPLQTYAEVDAQLDKTRTPRMVRSKLGSSELPLKQSSCLAQNLLDKASDLVHNSLTNF